MFSLGRTVGCLARYLRVIFLPFLPLVFDLLFVFECFGRHKGYRGGVGHCLDIGEISDAKWEFIEATEYGQDAALA